MKVKGFQVAPSELEGHLLNHPDVVDVAVVGKPDEYAGELPMAFVVLHESTKAKLADNVIGSAALKAVLSKVTLVLWMEMYGTYEPRIACLRSQESLQVVSWGCLFCGRYSAKSEWQDPAEDLG